MILIAALAHLFIFPALAKEQTIQGTVCSRPDPPSLIAPDDHFISSTPVIRLRGLTVPGMGVQVTENAALVATLTSASDGTFGSDLSLFLDVNQITVTVTNSCGSSSSPVSRTVTLMPTAAIPVQRSPVPMASSPSSSPFSQAPTPTPVPIPTSVSKPVSGAAPTRPARPSPTPYLLTLSLDKASGSVSSAGIFISGITASQAVLTFKSNRQVVAAGTAAADGRFSVEVPLKYGLNEIDVAAELDDQAQTASLHVTRILPTRLGQDHPGIVTSVSVAILAVLVSGGTLWVIRRRGLQ